MDGATSSEGRLEVLYNGQWGTVCSERWSSKLFDDLDAGIVCRMLGFDSGTAQDSSIYGEGNGPIWLSHLECKGDELSIFDCPTDYRHPIGSADFYCEHTQDVGVKCQGQFSFNFL